MTPEDRKVARENGKLRRDAIISETVARMKDFEREYFEGIPEHGKWIWIQTYKAIAQSRQAIKAKCLDCSAYQRLEVKNCTVTLCPLYKYRPYQND